MSAANSTSLCALKGFVVANKSLTQISEGESAASLASFVIAVVWLLANFAYFRYWKNCYARTQVRVTPFLGTYLFADLLFLTGWHLPIAPGIIGNYPCWLMYGFVAMSIGCFNAANFTRNTAFMLMTSLSYATQSNGRIPLEDIAKVEEAQEALQGWGRIKENARLIWFGLRFVFIPNGIRGKKSRAEHITTLVALRFVSSRKGALLFTVACLLPYLVLVVVVCLVYPPFRAGCVGCIPDNGPTVVMVVILGVLLLSLAMVFNYKCSSLPDVWGVFLEESLSASGVGGAFLGFILISFTGIENRYYFNILIAVALMIGFSTTTTFQIYLASKSEKKINPESKNGGAIVGSPNVNANRKTLHNGTPLNKTPQKKEKPKRSSQVDHESGNQDQDPAAATVGKTSSNSSQHEGPRGSSLNVNGPVTSSSADVLSTVRTIVYDFRSQVPHLHEILSTPHLVEAFQVHCLREFCDENLNFLQNASDWKATFSDIARTASTARAKKIVNTFIRDGGLQQINLPFSQAQVLIKKVESGAQFDHTDFDDARFEIARLLENGSVARFLVSPQYRNILSGAVVVNAVAGDMA